MSDPLSQILAVPPALDAMKNIIRAFLSGGVRGSSGGSSASPEVDALDNHLDGIIHNLLGFCEFGLELERWKCLHHATSIVLLADLPHTFHYTHQPRAQFTALVTADHDRVASEIHRLMSGRQGAITYIQSLGPHCCTIPHLAGGFSSPDGKWTSILLDLSKDCEDQLNAGNYGSLYDAATRLYNFCNIQNFKADEHLKDGIIKITHHMNEVHKGLRSLLREPT